MRRLLQRYVLCLIGLIVFLPEYAQVAWTHPDNELLPQPFIYKIARDTNGFFFIGTGNGVVRCNGTEFLPVEYRDSLHHFTGDILCSDSGTFLATREGVIYSIDQLSATPLLRTEGEPFLQLHEHPDYGLLALTPRCLLQFGRSGKADTLYHHKEGSLRSMGTDKTQIWLADASGVFRWHSKEKPASNKQDITILKWVETGNELIGLSSNRLWEWKNGQWRSSPLPGIRMQNIISVFRETHNRIWLADRGGLFRLDRENGQWSCNMIPTQPGIPATGFGGVWCENGQLWLGTLGYGLFYLNLHDYFSLLPVEEAPTAILAWDNRQFVVASASALWLADLQQPLRPQLTRLLKTDGITSLATWQNGFLAGTDKGRILHFVWSGNGAPVLQKTVRLPANTPVYQVQQHRGELLVSQSLHGVWHLNDRLEQVNHWTTTNGLLHNEILETQTGPAGRQWFISRASGLAYRESGKFKYMGASDGFISLEFTSASPTEDGYLALATDGGGITFIDEQLNVSHLTDDSGLPTNEFYGIRYAPRFGILATSRTQLVYIRDRNIHPYRQQSFPAELLLLDRAIAPGDKAIGIGCDRGVLFHVRDPNFIPELPTVVLEQITVDGEQVNGKGLSLAYGKHKVQFVISATQAGMNGDVYLERKLEGFDTEWLPLTGRQVTYQSVREGEYEFKVRLREQSQESVTYPFSVAVPLWKRKDFFILVILGSAGLVFLIMRWRNRQLKYRNMWLEEKVNERTVELQRKNKELEQFTYAISHDLKNPAINLNELVRIFNETRKELNEDARLVWVQIEKASGKLLHNLMDLLEVLKVANQQALTIQAIDIAEEVEDIKESITHMIARHDARINLELDEMTTIEYNRAQLHSVLYNLITNAIKYRKPEETPEVCIRTFRQGGFAGLSVKDNGLGIDLKEHGEKLFTLFKRIHSHVEGTGVGLSLVHSIVTKNGGKIEVHSEPGQGTEFKLYLVQENS